MTRSILCLPLLLLTALTMPAQTQVNLTGPNGAVTPYTLRDHPRVWLDGPAGPVTLAIKDPDGPGGAVSWRASSVPGVATFKMATDYRKTWNGDMSGSAALATAFGWFMNNRAKFSDGVSYKDDFVDIIMNRAERTYTFGGCDVGANGCGNINVDYTGEWMTSWALAYTAIRSELTTAQKSHFAALMLNGIIDLPCESRLKRRAGAVSKSGNILTLTGAMWDATVVKGAMIYTKSVATHGSGGSWQLITAVNSPTQITTNTGYGSSTDHWYFTMAPWDDAKSCGLGNMASQHGNTPPYVAKTASTSLTAPVSATTDPPPLEGVTQTITINSSGWLPQGLPYWIRVGGSYLTTAEQMKVIAVNGNTLTVVRGLADKTLAFASGVPVIYYSHGQFASSEPSASFGLNNRNLTRASGYIAIAVALADDDPRARQLLELASPYWYAKTYVPAKEYFTIQNVSAIDYGLGRIASHFSSVVLIHKNSFTQSVGYESGDYIKNFIGLLPIYWTVPWNSAMFSDWGIVAIQGGCSTNYRSTPVCQAGLLTMPLLYPDSPETKWAWFHHKTLNNFLDNSSFLSKLANQAGWGSSFSTLRYLLSGDQTGVDYREMLPTSRVWAKGDSGVNKGLGTFVSRSDWSSNSTALFGLFIDNYTDKLVADNASTYSIGKNGWLIDNSSASNSAGQKAMVSGEQQGIDFGLAYKGGSSAAPGDLSQRISAGKVTPDYFYTKVDARQIHNGNNGYHQVLRQWRHFLHLKTDKEYIVAFDDVGKGNPERIRDFIHYPNNGEEREGVTHTNWDASIVESSNGSAKIITQWLMPMAGADSKVYDIGVSIAGAIVTIGKDCSPAAPCRAKVSGVVGAVTAPGTFTLTSTPAGPSAAFLYLDPADWQLKAGWQAGMGGQACGGALQCVGEMTDFPPGVVRLARPAYRGNALVAGQCPGALAVNRWTAAVEWGSCVGAKDRVLFLDNGTTTDAEFLIVHRPTSDQSEEPDEIKALPAVSSNYAGVQINSTAPAVILFPRRSATYSSATFTSDHSGEARVLISGLSAGDYTVLLNEKRLLNASVGADGVLFLRGNAGVYRVTMTNAAGLRVESTTIADAQIGSRYEIPLEVVGGVPPYTWAVTVGALPQGVVLEPDGTLSGAPAAAGTFLFTVSATDSADPAISASQELRLVVKGGNELSILPESLPTAFAGMQPYGVVLVASGGAAPYQWSLESSSLPPGLALNGSTGVLSGIPTEVGEYTFIVRVSDSNSPAIWKNKEYQLSIQLGAAPLSILTEDLPGAVSGDPYQGRLVATGGALPYTWTLQEGSLPEGLTLTEDGLLSGIPQEARISTLDFRVRDSSASAQTAVVQLVLVTSDAASAGLRLRVLASSHDRALAQYGRTGLQTQQVCSIVLSQDASFTNVIEQYYDPGGRSLRDMILGGASASDQRHLDGSSGSVYRPRATQAAGVSSGSF